MYERLLKFMPTAKMSAGLVIVALMASLGSALLQGSKAAVTPKPAKQADSFVDSIGVATHLTYLDTTYGNWPIIEQRLVESGIRHIRDGWGTGSSYANDRVKSASAKIPGGLKLSAGHDARYTTQNGIPVLKDWFKAQGMIPYLDYVEGPNEWDNYDLAGIRPYMQQMASVYRSDPATRHLTILGPSFACQGCRDKFQSVGDLTAYIDRGNPHDYPGGEMMSDGMLDMISSNNALISGNKPLVSTETDYSTAVGANDCLHPCVPEDRAATLGLRIYFEHFRRGWERSYKYEFIDQFPENNFEKRFGMIRHDFTPKPMFNAVKNTIQLLSDLGPSFTPGSLSYDLVGANAATRQLLLQKRDGSFWLAVWQQTEVWNRGALQPVNPPDVPLTLQLENAANSINTYRPNFGTAATATGSGTSMTFNAGANMTLIRIASSITSTPPTTGGADLVVAAISKSPANAAAGDAVTLSATIKNQGTSATPAGTIHGVAFSVDGSVVSWSDSHTASLAPGASVTVTANSGPGATKTWMAIEGSHTIVAYVDDIDRIAESNDANNTLNAVVNIGAVAQPPAGQPDLVVTAITTTPAIPTTGSRVTFSATVKNQGTGPTPAGIIHGVSFRVNGTAVSWSDTSTASIPAGGSVTLTANNGPNGTKEWTATAGNPTLEAVIDDINRIDNESNESNNSFSKQITVADNTTQVQGDVNGDNRVNALDLSVLLGKDGQNYPPADINRDGTVGAADLAILLSKWTW